MVGRSWRDNWEIVGELPGGGHGYTHTVRRRNDASAPLCVLKTLKNQESTERRARMFGEASALQILVHPRVARFVESNSEHYADTTTKLYLVTEFIDGSPMSSIVEAAEVEDACDCLNAILDAISFCHQRGQLHRDLKPDNIILRGNDLRDPVLIDFGQTFNAEDTFGGFQTEDRQHLGNRFMHLPELMTSGADKRNQLSDISFCVGLLFFLLTRTAPEALRDHAQRRPHEREPARSILGKLPPPRLRQLTRIFAVGFSEDFDLRWQSIEDLRRAIAELKNPDRIANAVPFTDLLDLIKQTTLQNPEHAARLRLAEINAEMVKSIQQSWWTLLQRLEGILTGTLGGTQFNAAKGESSTILVLSHPQYRETLSLQIRFARFRGQTALYGVRDPAQKGEHVVELMRMSLSDPDISTKFRGAYETFVAEQISAWLDQLAIRG